MGRKKSSGVEMTPVSWEEMKEANDIMSEICGDSIVTTNADHMKFTSMTNTFDKLAFHEELCRKMHYLYVSKNNDYGDSVNDTFKKFGIDAFLVRMYDKINRVYSLTRTQAESKVQDEKIEDTLMDLANYAIIALTELEAERNKVEVITDENEIKKIFDKSNTVKHTGNIFRDGPAVGTVDFSNCNKQCKKQLEKFKKELED